MLILTIEKVLGGDRNPVQTSVAKQKRSATLQRKFPVNAILYQIPCQDFDARLAIATVETVETRGVKDCAPSQGFYLYPVLTNPSIAISDREISVGIAA
jgi:hypothetical protein